MLIANNRRAIVVMHLALAGCAAAQTCGGLVGHWPFEGNANDVSLTGNNGTLIGDPAFTPGTSGMAIQLDGSDDFVSVANSPSLNPATSMSISAWYRPVSFSGSGNDAIVDKGYYGHYDYYYQYHLGVSGDRYNAYSGTFGFNIRLGGVGTNRGFWIPNRWYHLVSSWDGAVCKLYVDGVLVSSNPLVGAVPDYGKPVFFGRFTNLPFYLPGAIDEIRIYNRALSADEATLLFSNPDGSPMVTPPAVSTCPDASVDFAVTSLTAGTDSYQWRRNGVDIQDAHSASLHLEHITGDDIGAYDCIVTTPCGTHLSSPATLTICPGEFNCDGGVDGSDIDAFFAAWEGGESVADVNQDGGIDGADVDFFFTRWEGGC